MAINRFFKPVDYEYTPIPFQELVTLGKYYADERKQAEKDLATYIQKANEFTSLLSKDVDTYNKTAFNPQVKQYIQQAASNPSVMRDMSWRSGLQAAINSVDYGMLNKLKSSAESAKLYDAAAKKLAIEGKLPPGWEPNYFDTYSTAESGVFNENPLPYQSKTDIVKPYLDNLKDSYLGTEGGYDYYGVNAETIAKQLKIFESDILNNPSNQREIQRYVQRGMSLEDATDFVLNQVNTAGLEFMRMNRTINPIYEIDKRAEAAARKASGNNYSGNAFLFTQSMAQAARNKASAAANDYLKALYPEKYEAMKTGYDKNATAEQKAAAEKAIKELQELRKNISDEDVRKAMYKEGAQNGGTFVSGESVSTNAAVAAGNMFLQAYGDESAVGGEYNEVLTDNIRGISDKREDGNRTVIGATNLSLLPVTAAGIVDEKIDENSPLLALDQAIKQGKFKLEIVGAGGTMNFPSGADSSVNYGYVNVSIPEEAILDSNIIDIFGATAEISNAVADFKKEYGEDPQLKDIDPDIRKRALQYVLKNIAQKTEDYPEQNYSETRNKKNTSITRSAKTQGPVYTFTMTYPLAGHHGGIAAENLNASVAKKRKTMAQTGEEQLYNFIMSNMQ